MKIKRDFRYLLKDRMDDRIFSHFTRHLLIPDKTVPFNGLGTSKLERFTMLQFLRRHGPLRTFDGHCVNLDLKNGFNDHIFSKVYLIIWYVPFNEDESFALRRVRKQEILVFFIFHFFHDIIIMINER